MPRRNRKTKKGGGGGGGGDDIGSGGANKTSSSPGGGDDIEYLSETHTIATLNSVGNTSNVSLGFGDSDSNDNDDWQLGDDDVDNIDFDRNNEDGIAKAEARYQRFMETLSLLDDFLQEKRSSKRESILKQLFKAFTQHAYTEATSQSLYNRRDDLIKVCKSALMRGTPSEQYAACRVLESAVVLIGDESYFEEISTFIRKIIEGTHRAIPVRSAALRVLGMTVFVGVDDDVITESILDLCEILIKQEYRNQPNPSSLRATAIDVWTLLATTIHELYVSGKDDVSIGRGLLLLPILSECLEQSDDLGLRSAAGECIAYIHTARLALGVMDGDDDDNEADSDDDGADDGEHAHHAHHATTHNVTERKYLQGSWEGSEWEDIMNEIEYTMTELSNQSGHHMSKKDKKQQRATFREYLATISDNELPNEILQFRGGSLEFTKWSDIIALQYFRRCLQGGFQLQLLTNPTLQTIFGANASQLNANGQYSQLEKRLILSKTSEVNKLKDMDRTKKRRNRTNVKNHFLTVDGDDV